MKTKLEQIQYCFRQVRYYQNQIMKLIASDASDAEKESEEKENLPPTPPIREKEDKEKDLPIPRAREDLDRKAAEETFKAFWFAYPGPRKIDKKKCREKFLKLAKEHKYATTFYDKVFAGLNRWKLCFDWQKDNGTYICAPLVWLNNERWNAEVQAVAPTVAQAPRNRPDNYLAPTAEEIEEAKKLF